MKEHIFHVRGTWPFPVDMLRYDDAKPSAPVDQSLIEHLSADTPGPEVFDDNNRLAVVTVTLKGPRRPTEARWASFLWRVV